MLFPAFCKEKFEILLKIILISQNKFEKCVDPAPWLVSEPAHVLFNQLMIRNNYRVLAIDRPAHAGRFLLWLMLHPESDIDYYENYQQMVKDRDLAFQFFCKHFEKHSL